MATSAPPPQTRTARSLCAGTIAEKMGIVDDDFDGLWTGEAADPNALEYLNSSPKKLEVWVAVIYHSAFFCEFCGKFAVKRKAVGIWGCKDCGKVRMAVFNQHHVDGLDLTVNPLLYMMKCYPGVPEQKLMAHLGSFGVTGNLALQSMYTLSDWYFYNSTDDNGFHSGTGAIEVSCYWKRFCCSPHKVCKIYRLYSRSHFVKALEVALLIIYIAYGYTKSEFEDVPDLYILKPLKYVGIEV
ncbi:hypothetical protein ABZP36_029524 [Zizania latifolia]